MDGNKINEDKLFTSTSLDNEAVRHLLGRVGFFENRDGNAVFLMNLLFDPETEEVIERDLIEYVIKRDENGNN